MGISATAIRSEVGAEQKVTASRTPLAQVAIVVLAYEARTTIVDVLDRIPDDVASSVGAILVSDDASADDTAVLARRWGLTRPDVDLHVVRQPANLGYGGNQRFCYQWASRNAYDHAIMVHGDGQYAPELIEAMVRPLLSGHADAVFGSRMLDRHGARRGGMPLYKRVGNRVLTRVQNQATGIRLSEWHSGYRAYSLSALEQIELDDLSAGFDFDTQIILAMTDVGGRVSEIAIPTHYGDEKCRVNGLRYAADVTRDVVRYRRRSSVT